MGESTINNQAADWVARLDRDDAPEDLRADFQNWLDDDRRHRGAFLRAEAAWGLFDRGRALQAQARPAPKPRRSLMVGGAAAAAAIAVAVAGAWLSYVPPAVSYRTGMGEMRRIRLEDGSIALLDAGSEITVSMQRRARRLELRSGEAWFEVAKDKKRPFTVESAGVAVRAVGTAFSVRHRADGADVLVTEGVVESAALRSPGAPVALPAGSKASVHRTGAVEVSTVSYAEASRSLAWREGRIALDGDTLGKAVESFNQRNVRKIVIRNSALNDAKIFGWFSLNDPESFARAASLTLDAEITFRNDEVILN